MKNIIILLTLFITIVGKSQNVGINNEDPTEKLDVTGNVRVRDLVDAENIPSYNKYVVTTGGNGEEGTFGFKTQEEINNKLFVFEKHRAEGLQWSTSTTKVGAQINTDKKLIFGTNNEDGLSTGDPWNRPVNNDYFSASVGDFIDVSPKVSFKVTEVDGSAINSVSANGDRQVIFYLYLYRGTTLIKKAIKIVNFRGRYNPSAGNSEYEDIYIEDLRLFHHVTEYSSEFNVSVVAELKAPRDANFGVDFDANRTLKQILLVTKS